MDHVLEKVVEENGISMMDGFPRYKCRGYFPMSNGYNIRGREG
jgi:hypothetical protein